MEQLRRAFANHPSQGRAATLMLKHGISIRDGRAWCGAIEQADAAIARAAGVDHRVVRSAIVRIGEEPELAAIFARIRPILLLADIAHEIGCSTLEIIPADATRPGILAEVTGLICKQGLTVRQAVIDDPGKREDSRLIIVVDGTIPAYLIPMIRSCGGVAAVTVR